MNPIVYLIPVLALVSVACLVYALMPARKDDEERVRRRISGQADVDDVDEE